MKFSKNKCKARRKYRTAFTGGIFRDISRRLCSRAKIFVLIFFAMISVELAIRLKRLISRKYILGEGEGDNIVYICYI